MSKPQPIPSPYPPTHSVLDGTHNSRRDRSGDEEDITKPLPGWPSVTRLIAEYPDFEAFQPFKDLNLKSLLYYQAELENLRLRLHRMEYEDHDKGDPNKTPFSSEWVDDLSSFVMCEGYEDKAYREQWDLIKRIRVVLKEYNEALLQYSQVTALPKADPYNIESFRILLKQLPGSGPNGIHCISGIGANTWGNLNDDVKLAKPLEKQFFDLLGSLVWTRKHEHKLELIVPRKGHKIDGLTTWVASEFVPFWQSLRNSLRRKQANQGQLPRARSTQHNSLDKPASNGVIAKLFALANLWHKRKSSGSPAPEPTAATATATPKLDVYTHARMIRFTSSLATIIACLLPTVAIAVLAGLDSTRDVLGVITAFTAIFAMGLIFLTSDDTSRVEIFTATAAFSAVMVVFVQNQGVGGPSATASGGAQNGTYRNTTDG